MTAPTIKKINDILASDGVEVVKGNGYFYFADTGEAYIAQHIPSVFMMHLRGMSLEDWVAHARDYIAAKVAA